MTMRGGTLHVVWCSACSLTHSAVGECLLGWRGQRCAVVGGGGNAGEGAEVRVCVVLFAPQAALDGNEFLVAYLVERGADYGLLNAAGRTAEEVARSADHHNVERMLALMVRVLGVQGAAVGRCCPACTPARATKPCGVGPVSEPHPSPPPPHTQRTSNRWQRCIPISPGAKVRRMTCVVGLLVGVAARASRGEGSHRRRAFCGCGTDGART